MRRLATVLFGLFCLAPAAWGSSVMMFVDTIPATNQAYIDWRSEVYDTITGGGSIVNMAHGQYVGETRYTAEELVVDNQPDYGRRLLWGFWIPGETIASLSERFYFGTRFDWCGVECYGLDGNAWEDCSSPYLQWLDVPPDGSVAGGGVLGIFSDNFAVGQAVVNGELIGYADKASLLRDVNLYHTHFCGEIAIWNPTSEQWESHRLQAELAAVPTPLAAPAGLILLAFVGVAHRMRKSRVA